MTPGALIYPQPESNITGFNTADLPLCPTYKVYFAAKTSHFRLKKMYSEANSIFSWKNSENLIKLYFEWYTLLYTLRKMFSQNMPWYSKHYKNLVTCHFREVFFNFFGLMWLEWTPLLVFQNTFIYFADNFFLKFAWRFQILQKFGHFFTIFVIFFNFVVSLTN